MRTAQDLEGLQVAGAGHDNGQRQHANAQAQLQRLLVHLAHAGAGPCPPPDLKLLMLCWGAAEPVHHMHSGKHKQHLTRALCYILVMSACSLHTGI